MPVCGVFMPGPPSPCARHTRCAARDEMRWRVTATLAAPRRSASTGRRGSRGACSYVVLRFQSRDEEVHAVAAFIRPIGVERVRQDAGTHDVLCFAVMDGNTLVAVEHLQHVGIFGATLTAKRVTALGGFGDAEFYDYAMPAPLPSDQVAVSKDSRLGDGEF